MRVPKKLSERVLERGGLSVSTGKGRIHVSTEKLSRRVPKNGIISVSTKKWSNPGEYREKVESVQVPKNCPGDYLKSVESVYVSENGRIWANTGKM